MKKFLTGLMIAATLVSGVGATAAMAAPHHDNRPVQARMDHRQPAHVTRAAPRGHHWQRGQKMNRHERARHVVNDWRRHGLRAPDRGQHWVREHRNAGDYILVSRTTGRIASVVIR